MLKAHFSDSVITLSVVSHGQENLLQEPLHDLASNDSTAWVIITHNLAGIGDCGEPQFLAALTLAAARGARRKEAALSAALTSALAALAA